MNVTLPLNLFLDTVLRDSHSAPISSTVAEVLRALGRGERIPTFYIQIESRDGSHMSPVLWRYAAWKSDSDSWELAKIRSEREREARWVHEENVRRLAVRISSETQLPLELAFIQAHRKLRNGNVNLITNVFKVRLAKTIQDI